VQPAPHLDRPARRRDGPPARGRATFFAAAATASSVRSQATTRASGNATAIAQARLPERVTVGQGDLFAPLDASLAGQVDLVVCNPPHISTRRRHRLVGEVAGDDPRVRERDRDRAGEIAGAAAQVDDGRRSRPVAQRGSACRSG
jgi:hypothetical protein